MCPVCVPHGLLTHGCSSLVLNRVCGLCCNVHGRQLSELERYPIRKIIIIDLVMSGSKRAVVLVEVPSQSVRFSKFPFFSVSFL
jgi:hypothetical protein